MNDRPLRWTDNHCHLGWGERGDGSVDAVGVRDVLNAARQVGVERVVSVGTDLERSRQAIELAGRHPGIVWATVGLHPHEASHGLDGLEELLESEASSSAVVAVGECGLDYYYEHSPRDVQREAFAAQIGLAHQLGLALVIHTRDAWDDTFKILDAEGVPERTVLHCFTGGPEEARQCLDRGMFVSFSGIITFRNAQDVRDAAALCPPDRVLVETDSPYLAPVPHRGKPNSPQHLPEVGASLAEAMGLPVEAVAQATWHNATIAYRL